MGGLSTISTLVVGGAEYLIRLPQHQATQAAWLAAFAVLSFILQLLIIPSGSLLLIGAGFVFGVLPSVAIFTVAQCLAIWPIYRICKHGLAVNSARVRRTVDTFLEKSRVSQIIGSEPLISGMVLRLTPVVPSAAATAVAAFSGINLSVFLTSTILVGWVRPLFFASIGGSVKEMSGFATALSGEFQVAPLVLVFIAVVLLLLVRLWLRSRRYTPR